MKLKNKIVFGLIFVSSFIQNAYAYKYTVTNNTDEAVTVQIVTSLLGAPKPKAENLQASKTTTLKVTGFAWGACLDKIEITGKTSGTAAEIPYKVIQNLNEPQSILNETCYF